MSNHEMLVRMAKAISGQDDAGWAALPADDRERLYGGGKWHDAGRTRADYLDDARAALLSLRELPEAVEAGDEAGTMSRDGQRVWAAIIDHIVGEGE